MNGIKDLDYMIFQTLNTIPYEYPFLQSTMIFFADYAQWIIGASILWYWFHPKKKDRLLTLKIVTSTALAVGVNEIIRHFWYRARPFVEHDVNQLIEHSASSSFPSNHAACAFAIAFSIFLYSNKKGTPWLLLAGLIAVSRIFVGVHYPSDVFIGAGLGIALSWFVSRFVFAWNPVKRVSQACIGFYEKVVSKFSSKQKAS